MVAADWSGKQMTTTTTTTRAQLGWVAQKSFKDPCVPIDRGDFQDHVCCFWMDGEQAPGFRLFLLGRTDKIEG